MKVERENMDKKKVKSILNEGKALVAKLSKNFLIAPGLLSFSIDIPKEFSKISTRDGMQLRTNNNNPVIPK